jgi:nitrogen fixation NifU-like protein
VRERHWLEIDMTEQGETNDLDCWVAVLQEAILEGERALFSAKVLAEARQPRNMGVMLDPDGHALLLGPCGDTMEMFLRIRDSRIEIAAFMTDGCGPTVACGSMLTRMVRGRSLAEAAAIEAADLITALDGLPPEHIHCATLAVHTLRQSMDTCCLPSENGSE